MSGLNLDVCVLSQCLTTAQKLAIKNALIKIKLQENLPALRFWGRVTGTAADYFLAVATEMDHAIKKRFYWSNDEGVTFAQLPAPDEFVSSKAPKIRGLFTGNPSLKYKDPDAPPKLDEDGQPIDEDEEEEEEEEEPVDEDEVDEDGNPVVRAPPPRRLTELERLSHNVREIEHATGVVPRGAYYLTPTGEILTNPAFTGLSVEESRKLSSYVLLRDAEHASTLASVRKSQGVANHADFLDPIVPKGAKVQHLWGVHVDDSGMEVSLRSLEFPGFEYTLEAGTTNYAGAYFGLGEKNTDILFML